MRLVFKGGFQCSDCNAEEDEVEIIMICGKIYAASIIFSREKCGVHSSAVFIQENMVYTVYLTPLIK